MSQLFISHSSRNNAEAVAIRDWMAREGWDDVFLDVDPHRGIAAGERWERALNQAAYRCEAVLFLVSRDWLASGWCLKEFGLAHRLNKRLFGILIEDIPTADLPANLTGTWQLVNLAAGRDHEMFAVALPFTHEEQHVTFSAEGLKRLRTGLRRAGLDPTAFSWPPKDDAERAPYPGLRPLEAADAGIFFGREAPTIEALDRMRALREAVAPRLLCILGASGSGKSSFLRAGLYPRLSRDDRHFLPLPVLRPERAAITGKTGLVSILEAACRARGIPIPRAEIREAVAAGAAALRPFLALIVESATPPASLAETGQEVVRPPLLVLPIDQGEELFLAEGAREGAELLTLLQDLLTDDSPALAVLMTIRSDAFERLQLAPELREIGPQTMTFGPMPRGVYGTLIEGPAARMREADRPLAIDPALEEALLADLEEGGGRDALPLLAFTLERLWLDYGSGGRLTLAHYDRLGRIGGSIEAAVEEALRRADSDTRIPRDREARLALLRRGLVPWLAGIDPETGSPRRRVARRAEIPEEALPLVDLLVEARLLSADTDRTTGEATVEPAHEALLRQWGLLQGWLGEDFGKLAALEGVRRATRDWDANRRNAAWLAHGGDRLDEAERLRQRPDLAAQLGRAEQDYLASCRAEARSRSRLRRAVRWGSLAAAMLLAAFLAAALWQWRDAVGQRREAERQTGIAREQTARAEREAGNARDRTAEVEREKAEADRQRGIAERQTELAQQREREAGEQRDAAKRALANAKAAADGLIFDLAQGLRGRGLPIATVRDVLGRAETLMARLVEAAADDPGLLRSQGAMLAEFADTYAAAGDTEKQREAAERSLAISRRLATADPSNADVSRDLSMSLDKVGDVQVARGDVAAALASYGESLAIRRRLAAADPSDVGASRDLSVSLKKVGDVQVARGDVAAALASYEESLTIARRLAAADPSDVGASRDLSVSLDRLGDIQIARGDLAAGLASYGESLAIRRRLAAADPSNVGASRDLSVSLKKVGDVQVARGDVAAALASYEESLTIARRLAAADPSDAGASRDLSVSLFKVGDVQVARGDVVAALASYEESLTIARRLAAADPSDAGASRDLSVSLDRLGNIQVARGDMAAALASYEEGLAIRRRLAAAPSNVGASRDVWVSLNKVGDVQVARGDIAAALANYEEGLAIARRLASADPSDAGAARDLSVSLERVGDVQVARGDVATALASYEAGLEIARRLAAADPSNAGAARDLSVSLLKVGDVQAARDDFAAALASYEEGLAIRRRLAAADPSNAVASRDISTNLSRLALLEIKRKRYPEACRFIAEGLSVLLPFRDRPGIAKVFTDDLAWFQEEQATCGGVQAGELGGAAYRALMARDFAAALRASDEAIALAPALIWLHTNRAHSLMLLDRVDEARAVYLKYRGQIAQGEVPWEKTVTDDFAELRKAGITHPLMDEIEAAFAKP